MILQQKNVRINGTKGEIKLEIKAYDKIFNCLSVKLLDIEPVSRQITDFHELEQILKLSGGISLKDLETTTNITEVRAEEWIYTSNFKYVVCEIDFNKQDSKETNTIQKRILTTDSLTLALDFTKKRVAIEQMLLSIPTSLDLFPKSQRKLETTDITVYMNGLEIINYKKLKNLTNEKILKEVYLQYNSAKNYLDSFDGLYKISKDNPLEILYNDSIPMFIQTLDNKQMPEFQSTSNIQNRKIIRLINEEVDEIIQIIISSMEMHTKTTSPKKCRKPKK